MRHPPRIPLAPLPGAHTSQQSGCVWRGWRAHLDWSHPSRDSRRPLVASREETSSRGGGAPRSTSQPHCRFPATFAGRREVARGQAAVGVLRCGGAHPTFHLPGTFHPRTDPAEMRFSRFQEPGGWKASLTCPRFPPAAHGNPQGLVSGAARVERHVVTPFAPHPLDRKVTCDGTAAAP